MSDHRQLLFHDNGAETAVMADAPKAATPSEAIVAPSGLEQGDAFRDSEAEYTLEYPAVPGAATRSKRSRWPGCCERV
jgi:hypothetical protein